VKRTIVDSKGIERCLWCFEWGHLECRCHKGEHLVESAVGHIGTSQKGVETQAAHGPMKTWELFTPDPNHRDDA
jgi:hypothetical protein